MTGGGLQISIHEKLPILCRYSATLLSPQPQLEPSLLLLVFVLAGGVAYQGQRAPAIHRKKPALLPFLRFWPTVGHLGTIVMLSLFRNLLCQLCADFGLNPSAIELLIDAAPIH